jgi:hypothetical protein
MPAVYLINSSHIKKSSQEYYYYLYKTKLNYNQAFNNARLWALENDKELILTATRVYYIKETILKVLIF